jgi:hypothetical protein
MPKHQKWLSVVTVLAESKGEHREFFKINKGTDGSIYTNAPREPVEANPHVSGHASGITHAKYPDDGKGKPLYLLIDKGQPFSSFKGCRSLNEYALRKGEFGVLDKVDIAKISGDTFIVELDKYASPIVAVAVFFFDPSSKGLFDNKASTLKNAVTKIISTTTPNIGIVAYEH